MRNRLAILYAAQNLERLGAQMQSELGIRIGEHKYHFYWPKIMQTLDLRDVLDSVTIRFQTIQTSQQTGFLEEARRIFREEQVRYRIDDAGGVHFAVDAEFERMRVSTIAGLGRPRFQGVQQIFEDAFLAFDRSPPDGKAAIRSAFFAAESLFRLIFPSAHQLSGSEVNKHLRPLIDRIYDGQKPAIYLAQKQIASFVDWIDGAHFYRHEPGTEDPAQPPLELAIYSVSQAGGHIRWLAELDRMEVQGRSPR
ncbi:hypothetical protein [Synechococcus phage Yong-M2-251]|nr:hypothetical protein [Synechococcus phage Yong-M2-251]